MNVCLDKEAFEILESWFEDARAELEDSKMDFMKRVQDHHLAMDWDEQFKDDREVKRLGAVIHFFNKHELIDNKRLTE